jgi:predicted permease
MSTSTNPDGSLISYPLYKELVARNRLVSGLLASGRTARLDARIDAGTGEPEHPRGRFVSGNYFGVLGVPAHRGRVFTDADDRAIGASPVATISYAYWIRRFDGDDRVIGRVITVNGTPMTIAGVAPPSFPGEIVGQTTEMWIPLSMQPVLMPNEPLLSEWTASWLLLLGRLEPQVTQEQAAAGFTAIINQVLDEHFPPVAEANREPRNIIIGPGDKGFSRVRSTYRVPLLTLMTGAGLLLLIICANIANLLLARAVARSREIGVRLAIGAGRARLVRQLLTESVLLAVLSGAAALLVSWWGSRLLLSFAADGAPAIPLNTGLDLPVLGFALAVSMVAVVLFGLAPALRASRVDLASTMRADSRAVAGSLGARGQRVPLGRMLIAAQVALSLVLLIGAGLLVRNVHSMLDSDPGLDRDHLLIVDVDARGAGYTGDRLTVLTRDIEQRFSRLPGVRVVSHSENGIFSGTESANTFQIAGFTARTADDTSAFYDRVGSRYVEAIGARLLRGRDFTARDDALAPHVALVNRTMEQFYFPGGTAIGQRLRFNDSTSAEIVGVIDDVVDHDLTAAPVRRFYFPYEQPGLDDPGSLVFTVRTTGDPAALIASVRAELKAASPQLPVYGIDPLSILMRQSIREQRLLARLATGFGGLALLLAAIGLYGVMTYAIARRTGEIGLRVALGAQRSDVIGMVLRDALRLVLLGVGVGVPLALAATRLLQSQLHDVDSSDPLIIALCLAVLALTALLAALLPALRAARVAPLVALRQD